jgi:hypothetical protein
MNQYSRASIFNFGIEKSTQTDAMCKDSRLADFSKYIVQHLTIVLETWRKMASHQQKL